MGTDFITTPDNVNERIVISTSGIGTVRLRGLIIDGNDGAGHLGGRGIDIVAATTVYIEDCVISNFTKQGIFDRRTSTDVQSRLYVKDTVINDSAAAIVAVARGGVTLLDNVTSENNTYGIAVGTGNNVEIRNSVFSGNSAAGVEGDAGSHIVVRNSTISNNKFGVQSSSSVRIFNNTISYNNTAFSGSATTMGLNTYSSNIAMGTTPGVVPGAPADIGP